MLQRRGNGKRHKLVGHPNCLGQRRGSDRPANLPPRQREGLSKGVERDRPIVHVGQLGDGDVPGAIVEEAVVDFVGEDEGVVLDGEIGDDLELTARTSGQHFKEEY